MAGLHGVLSIQKSKVYKTSQMHTTHSWDFLGQNLIDPKQLYFSAKGGQGVSIGIIDKGIDSSSKSFSDAGYTLVKQPPAGYVCPNGFTCNRKVIVGRYLVGGFDPNVAATDGEGHGTHTASTAAGSFVATSNFYGLAGPGSVRGGAPHAFLYIYKACDDKGNCNKEDVLKAMDMAILDKVDVLSLSIGLGDVFRGDPKYPGVEWPGSLFPVLQGISVVFSAGNDGPDPQTISNAVPWAITVAAATTDRAYPITITLGNSQQLVGHSWFYATPPDGVFQKQIVLVDSVRCTDEFTKDVIGGKIVLCFMWRKLLADAGYFPAVDVHNAVKMAVAGSAAGLIFASPYSLDGLEFLRPCGNIPCVMVDFTVAEQILSYTTPMPSFDRIISLSPQVTSIGEILAPKIASISSRGPTKFDTGLIKPDIAAPGVSILAADVKSKEGDPVKYGVRSGTSMACPHIAGIVALLKAVHPSWSPAALKSAIVTTASVVDKYGMPILSAVNGAPKKPADPFDFGGGFVDMNRAADPGLIYDMGPIDYDAVSACNLDWTADCVKGLRPLYNLNLPSIGIPDLKAGKPVTVKRTVTNVGSDRNAFYSVSVEAPPGVAVDVQPPVLAFGAGTTKLSFSVTFKAKHAVQGDYMFGSITWRERFGKHTVRIPLAARVVLHDFYSEL